MARIPTAAEGGLGNLAAQAVRDPAPSPVFGAPVSNTASILGGMVGQSLQSFAQTGQATAGAIMDAATQIQIEANEREAKNADLAYSKRVREMMFGDGTPENPGFYGLEGQNAVDALAETQASLGQMREEIASTLKNDRSRQMFSQSAAARLDAELQRATIHSFKQGKAADIDASEARINEFKDDAVARYNDPKALAQNKRAGIAEVVNFYQDRGAAPETIEAKVEEYTTEFHASIIERHLAGGDSLAAQAYFDLNIDEIDGRVHSSLLEDIAKATTSDLSGTKREMREHITSLNMGIPSQGLEELMAVVDSTPVGMNSAFDNLRQDFLDAVTDQPIVAEAMKLPPGEVGDFLSTFRARASSTDPAQRPSIDEVRQFEKIQRAHAVQAKAFADGDGLAVAANNGVIPPLGTLDFNDPESIAARVVAADAASEVYEVDIPPFLNAEVEGLIDIITGKGEAEPPSVEEVAIILNNVQEGLGEDAASFMVRDIIEKDQPAIALALQTVEERPGLAREMIKGQRFLNENKEFLPKFADQLAAASTVFGGGDTGLFTQDTLAARGDIMKAANGLYALRAAEAGESVFNAEIYEGAIRDTIGGTVTFNGALIVPPFPGMEQHEVDQTMRGIQNSTLLDADGELPKLGNGEDFTADMLVQSIWRDEAILRSTSLDGTYHILFPGVGYVLNGDQSAPYELNLRDVIGEIEAGKPVFGTFIQGADEAGGIAGGGAGFGGDIPMDIIAKISEDRATARGIETTFQQIPEPAAPEEGEAVIPRRRPAGLDVSMSRSKGFTASAEVASIGDLPTKMYKDSLNVPTIGFGFNLIKPGAREMIEGLGYNYEEVLRGKQKITHGDAFTLFQRDYAVAQDDARALVPNFDGLDFARKTVLTDMAFNLGREGLSGFTDMLSAIAAEDWDLAAREAEDSDWFRQVGRRGVRNVEVLRTGELKGFE